MFRIGSDLRDLSCVRVCWPEPYCFYLGYVARCLNTHLRVREKKKTTTTTTTMAIITGSRCGAGAPLYIHYYGLVIGTLQICLHFICSSLRPGLSVSLPPVLYVDFGRRRSSPSSHPRLLYASQVWVPFRIWSGIFFFGSCVLWSKHI